MTTPAVAATIRRLVQDLVTNPRRHRWGVCAPHAKRLCALPVAGDFEGYLLVTASGGVLRLPDEGGEPFEPPWPEPLLGIAEAVRLYPELRELLPPRPDGRPTCGHCAGRGHYGAVSRLQNVGGYVHESDLILCGYCCALGWIPAESDRDLVARPACPG